MPTISTLAISENSIIVTGSSILISGYTAHLTYAGVTADQVAINSAT